MEEERTSDVQPSGDEANDTADTPVTADDEPQDRLKAFEDELEEANRERSQYKDALLRAQADLTNYKRRADEEKDEQIRYANSRLILKVLPVLDDFNLAIGHAKESEAEASWIEGVELIQRKLQSLVESEAVSRIDVDDKDFDPAEHEALAYQESADHRDGQVLTVVRDGYKLHGRVIRPALVILAKTPEPDPEESGPSQEKETEDA